MSNIGHHAANFSISCSLQPLFTGMHIQGSKFKIHSIIIRKYYRKEKMEWKKIMKHMIGCAGSIYLVNLAFTHFIHPFYSTLNYDDLRISLIIYATLASSFSGSSRFLAEYIITNHCQELFASLLEFFMVFYTLVSIEHRTYIEQRT
jgi:hypothetical protein